MDEKDKPVVTGTAANKKKAPGAIPLKKPMRYKGALRAKGYPVILSDSRRVRLAVKGYV